MKLTSVQIDWINNERANFNRIIASEPKYGLGRYYMRLDSLQAIIDLHKIQVKEEKKVIARLKECKDSTQPTSPEQQELTEPTSKTN